MNATNGLTWILTNIEESLGLPQGFLMELRQEQDWSFVIKAHALIDSAVTHLLCNATDSRLATPFAHTELSSVRAGKIAFAESLGLLTERQRAYVRRFSELRNRLVHDVRNVSFKFSGHVAEMDKNQRATFVEFCTYFLATKSDANSGGGWVETAKTDPKYAIWWGLITLLTNIYRHDLVAKIAAEERNLMKEKAKLANLQALRTAHARRGPVS